VGWSQVKRPVRLEDVSRMMIQQSDDSNDSVSLSKLRFSFMCATFSNRENLDASDIPKSAPTECSAVNPGSVPVECDTFELGPALTGPRSPVTGVPVEGT
jgi:hypothetical protein